MDQREAHDQLWRNADADLVEEYVRHPIRPVEELLFARYASELSGRVFEIGVGGGRLTRRLVPLASQLTGIDVSERMIAHCRRSFPEARFETMDLHDLSGLGDASFDAVVAGYNVIDLLDHAGRDAVLDELRRILAPGGLLLFSSHNLHRAGRIPRPGKVLSRHPWQLLNNLRRRRERVANHRRLAPSQQRGDHWAILNDEAHEFSLLQYYATRDETARQLAEHGFELVECVDFEGAPVGLGEAAADCPELHYVARSATA